MGECGLTLDRALAHGSNEIYFQLHRREPNAAFGEIRDRPIAASCIGKCHDTAGVQKIVRRKQILSYLHSRQDPFVFDIKNLDPQQIGQPTLSKYVPVLRDLYRLQVITSQTGP